MKLLKQGFLYAIKYHVEWMIEFNGMSTCLVLFNAQGL